MTAVSADAAFTAADRMPMRGADPSAMTSGKTLEEASKDMHSLLLDFLPDSLKDKDPYPLRTAKACGENQVIIEFTPAEVLKVLLVNAMIETGTTQAALAAKLGVARQQIGRLISPYRATPFNDMCRDFAAMGKEVDINVKTRRKARSAD